MRRAGCNEQSHVSLRVRDRSTAGTLRSGCVKKDCGNAGGAERSHDAGDEGRAEAGKVREQAESRGAEAQRHVKKGGVRAHRESSALGRRAPDRFDAQTRINQRVTGAAQSGSEQRQRRPGRQPDQSQARRFDHCADERDLGAAKPVRHMAQENASG
jgi:hypothetical protein